MKALTKNFHPNSKHNEGYDFNLLIAAHPPLKAFVFKNDQIGRAHV